MRSSPKPDPKVAPNSATRYRTLRNGAIYDNQIKRIVGNQGGAPTTAITKENAVAMQSRQQQLKRERIAAGANAVVSGIGSVRDGAVFAGRDLDWVEAVAEQVTIKALDPDNPKQVDAARLLLQEAGLAEQRSAEQPSQALAAGAAIAAGLLRLADALRTRQQAADAAEDAEIIEE